MSERQVACSKNKDMKKRWESRKKKITFRPSLWSRFSSKQSSSEKQGRDVIHFDAGEPDFEPPKEVVEATVRAIRSGKARYTEPGGVPEVKKAISEHLNNKYALITHTKANNDDIGRQIGALLCILRTAKEFKDWHDFSRLASIQRPCSVHGFSVPSFSQHVWRIRGILTSTRYSNSKCNALVLNIPNNPTGKILDPKTFDQLIEIARNNDITIIGDEVYSDYILNEGAHFKSLLQVKDCKWIYATSLSKSYSMTGFRAGYIVADEATISKLESINSPDHD